MKYGIIIKSICFEMAHVVSMATDLTRSVISHMGFVYLLKLLYFSLLYPILYRILISGDGNIHQKIFSSSLSFILVYFPLYQSRAKRERATPRCVSLPSTLLPAPRPVRLSSWPPLR
jgi:hypothetical protein